MSGDIIARIAVIVDRITSTMTASLSYEALVALGNHVDGLIWVYAGGQPLL
jgi:hypothetical protein